MRKRWMIGVAGALALGVAVAVGLTTSMASAGAKIDIGDEVPNFEMTDQNGKTHNLADLKEAEKIGVLVFVSHACPWSRGAAPDISALAEEYKDKDVVVVGIDSDKNHDIEDIKAYTEEEGLAFNTVKDPGNHYADVVGANQTPEVFVMDKDGTLAYHGAWDDRKVPAEAGDTNYVANALDALIAGEEIKEAEVRAWGCTIKRGKRAGS